MDNKNTKKFTVTQFTEIVTCLYLYFFIILEVFLIITNHRRLFMVTVIGTLFAIVFVILDRALRKMDEIKQTLDNINNVNKVEVKEEIKEKQEN